MAFSDIRTRIADNINRSDIPDTAGGLIDRWINDSQRRICRAFNFAFMEAEADTALVVGQRNYGLPDASGSDLRFKTEISLEIIDANSNRVKLKRIFKQDAEWKDRYKDTTETGTPANYSLQKGQIYLYPIPDAALTMNLEYYGYLDDLSADADTNSLVSDYPEALEAFGTSSGFRYAFEEERGDYWESKGSALVQEMVKESNDNTFTNIEEGIEPEKGAGTTPRRRFIDDKPAGYQ
jgi:hypothetical protein